MLENVLNYAFPAFGGYVSRAHLTEDVVIMAALFSIAGTYILSQFTKDFGYLTWPINFCTVFFGACLANFFLAGFDFPTIGDISKPMLYTLIGMMTACLAMLWATGPQTH
jgi:hypothetical protein